MENRILIYYKIMKNFLHFLTYNNAVPITFGILFLGAGGAFAAANPEVILDSEEQVVSIDNTYIATKNLDKFTPKVRITSVKEDVEYYYVLYTFSTIDLKDSVWQDTVKENTLKVSKSDLGQYRDLGLYVMDQLQQKIEYEISYLKEVQVFEKQNITQKTVVTEYKGLVGAVLNDKTEVLPGYRPVVDEQIVAKAWQKPKDDPKPVVPVVKVPKIPVLEEVTTEEELVVEEEEVPTSTPVEDIQPDILPPTIQILGENPVRVLKGETYVDLGAVAYDSEDRQATIEIFVDGVVVTNVVIDTGETGEHTVTYRAIDSVGGVSESSRNVVVYEATPNTSTGGGGGNADAPLSDLSEDSATSSEETTPTPSEPVIEETPQEALVPSEVTGDGAPEVTKESTPTVQEGTPNDGGISIDQSALENL
jgi:hypothetical protein